jgi:hypothetical protein
MARKIINCIVCGILCSHRIWLTDPYTPGCESGQLSRYNVQSMGWTTEEFWFDSRGRGKKFSSVPPCPDWFRGQPRPLSTGYLQIFAGGKATGPWSDHSTPFSAQVKNPWSCSSPPPMSLHGVVPVYAQGQLYLSFTLSSSPSGLVSHRFGCL